MFIVIFPLIFQFGRRTDEGLIWAEEAWKTHLQILAYLIQFKNLPYMRFVHDCQSLAVVQCVQHFEYIAESGADVSMFHSLY